MSKLSVIRQSLETNPDVVIVRDIKEDYLGHDAYWDRGYNVAYDVAPKGGLYSAGELQNFMMGLVPEGLESISKENFSQNDKDSKLIFGSLYFTEEIGEATITKKGIITLTDEELLNGVGSEFCDGKRTFEYTDLPRFILRHIFVRVLPSEAFAREVLFGRNLKASSRFWATPADLLKYQTNQSVPA